MKKSSFMALVMGTFSGVFFALGMCMTMLPEWNAAKPGTVLGCIGMVLALVTLFVWRRMEKKAPIRVTGKAIGVSLLSIVGALTFGVGMCLAMVWGSLVPGIIIGLVGILALLCLIPICKGIKA